MQTFRVNTGEAQKLMLQVRNVLDDAWKGLVEREEHEISQGYDLTVPVNRLNLYMTLRNLDGADYRALHGSDCSLDLVKITHWSPDTCGCTVSMTWRRDLSEADRVHHSHRSHVKCEHHSHLNTHADHHAEVLAENQHKNRVLQHLHEKHGIHPKDVSWAHDAARELHVTLPKTDAETAKSVADAFPHRKTHVH